MSPAESRRGYLAKMRLNNAKRIFLRKTADGYLKLKIDMLITPRTASLQDSHLSGL